MIFATGNRLVMWLVAGSACLAAAWQTSASDQEGVPGEATAAWRDFQDQVARGVSHQCRQSVKDGPLLQVFETAVLGDWGLVHRFGKDFDKDTSDDVLRVSGPGHRFVALRTPASAWSMRSSEGVNSAGQDADFVGESFVAAHRPICVVAGQRVETFLANFSEVRCQSLPASGQSLMKIVFDEPVREFMVGDRSVTNGYLVCDAARQWRLVSWEIESVFRESGESVTHQAGFEYPDGTPSTVVFTYRFVVGNQPGQYGVDEYRRLPDKPGQEQFTPGYYGFRTAGPVPFWKKASFWLFSSGLAAICLAAVFRMIGKRNN